MRKDVNKMLFVGSIQQKEVFFKSAQDLGIVHFIDMSGVGTHDIPEDLEHLTRALKIMRSLPVIEQEDTENYQLVDSIVNEFLELHERIEKQAESLRILKLERARVEPLGFFSKEDIQYVEKEGDTKVFFYWAKHGTVREQALPQQVIYINSDHGIDYYMGISKEPLFVAPLVEMAVDNSLEDLDTKIHETEKALAKDDEKLKSFQKYSTFLHHALIQKLNRYNLLNTQEFVEMAMDDEVFAIEGWVPEDKVDQLEKLSKESDVYYEQIARESTDVVPTYLENEGVARVGEDLINIFDVPSSKDKDPSLWVLCFFALFFAMIIADAGYGLIFLGVVLFLRFKYKKMSGLGHRIWLLIGILAGTCIVWGTLSNSFFGIPLPPDSPWMKVSVINWLERNKTDYHWEHKDAVYQEWVKKYPQIATMTDPTEIAMTAAEKKPNGHMSYELYHKFTDNILMELAIFIGMVHIIISMLRYIKRKPSNFGWILFIIGCYFYIPKYLGATTLMQFLFGFNVDTMATDGIYLMIIGFSLVLGISIFRHKIFGLLESLEVIQVFSDVLSYLRLYALGMAGVIMSETVNDGALAIGGIIGIIIMIIGHTFNIVLSIMGGVIHGLRLNFLEWYHYSFEGGGKAFKPLEKMKIE
ncbi:MAG: V-type ATPase 116kDa subunit family protein [Parachlamydiales bacterium]|jgi:V/A-type H+-transporting ATPase subunit I